MTVQRGPKVEVVAAVRAFGVVPELEVEQAVAVPSE